MIPDAVIEKPPSAELRPDQKDTDSLPPYDVLDPIIEGYVELDLSNCRAQSTPATTVSSSARSRASSIATSTSGASLRRGCGCRPRRSARTAASRSRTAGPADRWSARNGRRGGRCCPSSRSLTATAAYGSTFVLVQDALERVTPVGFILLRFAVGALVLMPFALVRGWRRPGVESNPRSYVWACVVFGLVAFLGYSFQNAGLERTTTSNSAFITGLFVVFTPLVETVVLRRRPPSNVLVAGRRPSQPWACSCSRGLTSR